MAILVLFGMAILCIVALISGTTLVLQIINVPLRDEYGVAISGVPAPSVEKSDHHMVSSLLSLMIVVAMLVFLTWTVIELWFLTIVLS